MATYHLSTWHQHTGKIQNRSQTILKNTGQELRLKVQEYLPTHTCVWESQLIRVSIFIYDIEAIPLNSSQWTEASLKGCQRLLCITFTAVEATDAKLLPSPQKTIFDIDL